MNRQFKIKISFADNKITITDDVLNDLKWAVRNASRNLILRHRIEISDPYKKNGSVFLKLSIPEELTKKFNPGNRLRGISKFLLSMKDKHYSQHLIGTRLLFYEIVNDYGLSKNKYFEELGKFIFKY